MTTQPSSDSYLDLDLDGALAAVMRECYLDEVPDVIRYKDYPALWEERKQELLARLTSGEYRPHAASIVEVPKGTLVSRPIAVMDLTDRVLYEAIMDKIGPLVDSELTEEVRSARLYKKKSGRYAQPKQTKAWARFQRDGRKMCDLYEHVCMLTTDITSYFEFIDLDILIAELRQVPGVAKELVDLLARLLHGLSKYGDLNGIPQGPAVSSLLGNFYLRPLDAILRKLDVKFLRFQDDIKVFAEEPHLLRRAVHSLTPVVRGRHLNLSTAKTKILTGDAVREHFEDAHKDAIQYGMEIGAEEIGQELRELFDDAVKGDVRERDVKFAVNRLSKLDDPHAIPWILENLSSVPYLSAILVRYLSEHFSDHPEIESQVCSFLSDERVNIDPFVEIQLIRMLASADHLVTTTYDLLWKTLMHPAKDTRVRQFAARAIGHHIRDGRTADIELLRGFVGREAGQSELQRAILVSLYAADATDKGYLDGVASAYPALRAVCRYLRSNPSLPPP